MNKVSETPANRIARSKFQFGLKTLLLAPVFLAVLGAIGIWLGWMVAAALLPIPLAILVARSGATRITEALMGAAFIGILIALLLPSVKSAHTPASREQCSNNLKQIMLALHKYHDAYGSFPPAYVADADGGPMHSWRVLILPFLGYQELYNEYDFNQWWDGPENGALAAFVPQEFSCPADKAKVPWTTSYLLVTGEGTAWPDDHAPCLDEFTDDPSRTIAVVEIVNSPVHWMQPRDLSLDEALRGVGAAARLCVSSTHRGGAITGRVDGSAWFLSEQISREQLRALFTPDGGEDVGEL